MRFDLMEKQRLNRAAAPGTDLPPDSDRLLTRKEVCFVFKRDRTTLWRWESRGLKFVNGRILWSALLVWLHEDEERRRRDVKRRRN